MTKYIVVAYDDDDSASYVAKDGCRALFDEHSEAIEFCKWRGFIDRPNVVILPIIIPSTLPMHRNMEIEG